MLAAPLHLPVPKRKAAAGAAGGASPKRRREPPPRGAVPRERASLLCLGILTLKGLCRRHGLVQAGSKEEVVERLLSPCEARHRRRHQWPGMPSPVVLHEPPDYYVPAPEACRPAAPAASSPPARPQPASRRPPHRPRSVPLPSRFFDAARFRSDGSAAGKKRFLLAKKLAGKTIAQLREECRARGARVSGSKDDLIERLLPRARRPPQEPVAPARRVRRERSALLALTQRALRRLCREHGLIQKGTKGCLVQRLLDPLADEHQRKHLWPGMRAPVELSQPPDHYEVSVEREEEEAEEEVVEAEEAEKQPHHNHNHNHQQQQQQEQQQQEQQQQQPSTPPPPPPPIEYMHMPSYDDFSHLLPPPPPAP